MAQIKSKFIANSAVTAEKIANSAIDANKLATDSVEEAKIKASAVSEAKLATNAVTVLKIANNAVEESKIKDSAVTALKIATDAVEQDKIKDSAVSASKLAIDAVEEDKIKNSAVTSAKIAADAVNSSKILLDNAMALRAKNSTGIATDLMEYNAANALNFLKAPKLDGLLGIPSDSRSLMPREYLDNKLGAANGIATLDSSGKIPAEQLDISVMEYKGAWNASTNDPALTNVGNPPEDVGHFYTVSVAGTVDFGSGSITFAIGDSVILGPLGWEKIGRADAVASVNGKQGIVVLNTDDVNEGLTNKYFSATLAQSAVLSNDAFGIGWDGVTDKAPTLNAVYDAISNLSSSADGITFAPAGNIIAINVQDAIEELDTEKLALAGGIMSGDIDMDGNSLNNVNTVSSEAGQSLALETASTMDLKIGGNIYGMLNPDGNDLRVRAHSGDLLLQGNSGSVKLLDSSSLPRAQLNSVGVADFEIKTPAGNLSIESGGNATVKSSTGYVEIDSQGSNFITLSNDANINVTGAVMLSADMGIFAYSELKMDGGSVTHKITGLADGVADSDAATVGQVNAKINSSEKGQPLGVAQLDAAGKLLTTQVPYVAITDTFVVSNEASQLALVAQVGDVAVRTDESKSYILQVEPASSLANWVELKAPQIANAGALAFIPYGNIVATNVQFAIQELDDEKLALAGGTMAGNILMDQNSVSDADSFGFHNGGYISQMNAPGVENVKIYAPNDIVLNNGVGKVKIQSNLDMDSHQIKNVLASSTATDAVNRQELDDAIGAISLTAGAISFTPAGSIAASTVQAAIEELDTEVYAAIADVDGFAQDVLDGYNSMIAAFNSTTAKKETIELSSADYFELAVGSIVTGSLSAFIDRLALFEGADADYTLSIVGGKVRATFTNTLKSSPEAPIVGDIINVTYMVPLA